MISLRTFSPKVLLVFGFFLPLMGCGTQGPSSTEADQAIQKPIEVGLIGLTQPAERVIVGPEEMEPVEVIIMADLSGDGDESLLLPLGERKIFFDGIVADRIRENGQVIILSPEIAADCLALDCVEVMQGGELIAVRSELYDSLPQEDEPGEGEVEPDGADGDDGGGDRDDGPKGGDNPPGNGGASSPGLVDIQKTPKAGPHNKNVNIAAYRVGARITFGGKTGPKISTYANYKDKNNSAGVGCCTMRGAEIQSLWGILILASLLLFGVHLERGRARRRSELS